MLAVGIGGASFSSSSEPTDSGIDKTSSSESGPYAPVFSPRPSLPLISIVGSELEIFWAGKEGGGGKILPASAGAEAFDLCAPLGNGGANGVGGP